MLTGAGRFINREYLAMSTFDRPLPEPLAILNELAADLCWSWNHGGDELWQQINSEVWDHTHNPVSVLQLTSDAELARLAGDPAFVAQLDSLVKARRRYLDGPAWYSRHYPDQPVRGIAYFSMEFGVCDALPLYAGGLGILAGDYLKTASDLGVPLIGIGLLYQEGYFRQSLARDGWQQETYLYNDPGSLPLQPLQGADGSWLHIDTGFLCRQVRFRVWHARIGRIQLYLLDSNDPRNRPSDRGITSKLYGGSTELRLVQEIALGICGWRLVETLGLDIDVCHLNEGHAAFATLERARAYAEKNKTDFWRGLWATRIGNVFTTHTPVEAGFDRYPIALLKWYISEFAQHLGIPIDSLIGLGRARPEHSEEPFNMAYLALKTCARSNGVSRLHGAVSRRIFQPLFPRWPEREVPVGHVTNGVHIPTWDSIEADNLWTQLFGRERWRGELDDLDTRQLDQLSDKQLWQLAGHGRARLVDYTRHRLAEQFRYESAPDVCAIPAPNVLDPNILTLGFARRFAEYKRLDLLLRQPERLARLLCNERYPVQLLIAGKAHPADEVGKQVLQAWYHFIQRPDVSQHLVFIEDYDIALAQHLVQGVDVWLNMPRRPWEASGTSGMKVLVNGGLNLSSLDGWWAEAWNPEVGWSLGNGEEHEDDDRDAERLYQLLENDVIPLFYTRDAEGIPRRWVRTIRASMTQLTTRYSSNRMMHEYLDQYYLPAAAGWRERQRDKGALAAQLEAWRNQLTQHWHEIHIGEFEAAESDPSAIELTVYLGGIDPATIAVQMVADPRPPQEAHIIPMALLSHIEGAVHAYRFRAAVPERPLSDFTARVIPAHPQACIPAENPLITWQTRR
jgi:glycogen phosphorylase